MKSSETNAAGLQENIHASDDELVIETVQDVQPILDQNKRAQIEGVNMKAGMRHAASIPLVVFQQWDKEFRGKFGRPLMTAPKKIKEPFMKAKLNDPYNKFLRTWQGRL